MPLTPPSITTSAELDFLRLPLLVNGDSKEIRILPEGNVIERLKPTVYSFTHNRYGYAPGTEIIRARFTAAIFAYLDWFERTNRFGDYDSAFVRLEESPAGPFLIQRRVETCNLEVRVKRYHIGSPLHRYRYTGRYPSQQRGGQPISKWSRYEMPIVCFDWRHPMTDEHGVALADEPISDDYAKLWMENVHTAKRMAAGTFMRLEALFDRAGLVLVDICFFIDRTGTILYGEISPDCMRVREKGVSLDKDLWRDGKSQDTLLNGYSRLYELILNAIERTKKGEAS